MLSVLIGTCSVDVYIVWDRCGTSSLLRLLGNRSVIKCCLGIVRGEEHRIFSLLYLIIGSEIY